MLSLPQSEIHLWYANQAEFNGPELESNCLSWLTESETIRYHRYISDYHRKQFLLGRMMIRNSLSKYAEIEPQDWKFEENRYGKPVIVSSQRAKPLFFNLSHSSERLVLAIAAHVSIGVDIELCNKPRRVIKIADRYFSHSELEELCALPQHDHLSRFYDLWTLKEAYGKACGLGLIKSSQECSYHFPSDCRVSINLSDSHRGDVSEWQCWQIDLGRLYKVAVVVRSGKTKINSIFSKRLVALDEFINMDTKVLRG
ncbi:MAG: hypothetical protein CMQ41_03765 [Gammaproteobacteria bacterium]|nr:hypothetical protein [Gammaproteobacteria bacterium]